MPRKPGLHTPSPAPRLEPPVPKAVVLLGAQRFDPSLGASVTSLHVEGRIALITAGWQERESEDDELSAHIGGNTVNLRLHSRAESVFRADPAFHAAHRERQELLRHKQDFYRIRLEHALEAARVIRHRAAPEEIHEEEVATSIATLRELDNRHLDDCARLHREFDAEWKIAEREAIAEQRASLAKELANCEALAIAGGHVATLVNRLSLFGIAPLAAGRILFAWTGGAMAISSRVVLFHDDPPQGPGASEVLDCGLGLLPNIVVLPQQEERIHLDKLDRVRTMARRFSPARCLAFPARSQLTWRPAKPAQSESHRGTIESSDGVIELLSTGGHELLTEGAL